MWSNVKENFWMVAGTDASVIQAPGEFLHPGHPWTTPEAGWAGTALPTLTEVTVFRTQLNPFPRNSPTSVPPTAVFAFSALAKQFLHAPFCHSPLDPSVLGRQEHPHSQLI